MTHLDLSADPKMLTPGLGVSIRDRWILSRVTPNPILKDEARDLIQAQNFPYGCQLYFKRTRHLDQGLVLCNYLNKTISAESAARAITADFSIRCPEEDGRLRVRLRNEVWELLASTLLRFEDDCDMIVDLLAAIQSLPSMDSTPWWVAYPQPSDSLCELPGFHIVFQSCYQALRCECGGCDDQHFLTDKKYYRRAGIAEAKMYVRGIPGITEFWAYKTINLICRLDKHRELDEHLEFFIHEIHGWLQTAGPKLAETLDSNQVKSFVRAVRGRRDKSYESSVTMFEHWQHWKKSFLEVSFDEDFLSSEGRELARECHDIMKAQNIKLPLFF
ncbi:hypothetical protein FANTH_8826 [Fusarium anthophilum]|uniref:Uncharacterized protein n=1 Tax=Fusarium anthophilum TaxID=48485 RepID=A0A8H5E011_9HYPO|nr:hypothetical protein FANTH_8826 [Fusarium anthophilum]